MQPPGTHNGRADESRGGHASESKISLFEEVFEVHTEQACNDGASAEAEGADAKFEIEQHEGVSVCVENGFDAGKRGGG